MDCDDYGGIVVCGNFAERLDHEPENIDFTQAAKWYEDYPFDWRETLGGTVCNCKRVKVDYAPYYGFDYFHLDTCNLMRKLRDHPGITNLYESYLPSITNYSTSVPNSDRISLHIKNLSRSKRVSIKRAAAPVSQPQMELAL